MAERKRLYLLDGMAILFRGYYALINAHLTARSGEPTGGTFAFCTALVRLLEKHQPDLIAVAWDSKEPTFRHEQFADYKAHRDEFPEELIPQLHRVKEIVGLYHIPCLEAPGFEADDIIGTLARQATEKGYDVYCVTPDKDYMQLVDENTFLYRPSRPGSEEDIVDIEGVAKRFGVAPLQVVDVLALMGDSSDNIPGVRGIGEKTAIPLIQQFGSVENLYENIDQVEKKGVKKKLLENRENAFLSKELATIHLNVPISVTFEDLHLDPPDVPGLVAMYRELGLKSLVTRYEGQLGNQATPADSAQQSDGADAATEATPTSDEAATGADDPTSFDYSYKPLQTISDVSHTYELIRTEERLEELARYLSGHDALTFDLETDGLSWATATILGVALSVQPQEAFYVPIASEGGIRESNGGTLFDQDEEIKSTEGLPLDMVLKHLKPLLENPALPKVGQNIKFDMLMLRNYGVEAAPVGFDTMLASYVIDSSQSHNMDALAERYLNYKPISITELIGKRGKDQRTMRDVPVETVSDYACEDADITHRLYGELREKLKLETLETLADTIEFPLVEVLTGMEFRGVGIDVEALKEISATLQETIVHLEQEIHELAGRPFNVGSPKQLSQILFEELGLPTRKKTKTGYSTDQFVMEELAALHALPEKILDYRLAAKLKSTYVDALHDLINPKTKRIHTSYNQAVASTGRLSSNNPNLQNIPIRSQMGQEIRKAFVPGIPNGVLVAADYSQIELRIMAYVSGDEALIKAFRDNFDIHTATAMNVFNVAADDVEPNMRRKAKEVNFGIMYGIGAFGLARRLKIDRTEGKELIETYFRKYPGVQSYILTTLEKAREKGYVETLSGRRRYFPELNASNSAVRSGAERAAINMPIQGTASDIIKLAMIDIHRELAEQFPNAAMLLQVHDELVFEVPESEAEALADWVKTKMEQAFPLGEVPVVVDTGIGMNWYEAH